MTARSYQHLSRYGRSGRHNNRTSPNSPGVSDRLITRDMALVMLATFFFMSSNMLATPVVAGYGESMGRGRR